ncbi:MAG: exodeoxyribonuclease VII small subunit [Rikenellaceae bacterium]
MATQKEITYEEAIAKIEEVLAKFKNNEVSIDELAAETKRATELITLCRDRLTSAEKDLKKILE